MTSLQPSLSTTATGNGQNVHQQTDGSRSLSLSDLDLDELRKLPMDTLDTIRSKLVQLIEAVTNFRFQLESSPLSPHSLPYSALVSKLLILLNHTEALSQALNTPVPSKPVNRFELPSVRAEREERSKWEDGPSKRSLLGKVAVKPRSLEGLEDGKEWVLGVLTRTKLAPEIEKEEQELLSLLPPLTLPQSASTATPSTLLQHVRAVTRKHEEHISNCREALHKARYDRKDTMYVDSNGDEDGGGGGSGEEKYEWKMRVEVNEHSAKDSAVANAAATEEVPPSENPIIKGLLGFMKDGSNPTRQAVDGN